MRAPFGPKKSHWFDQISTWVKINSIYTVFWFLFFFFAFYGGMYSDLLAKRYFHFGAILTMAKKWLKKKSFLVWSHRKFCRFLDEANHLNGKEREERYVWSCGEFCTTWTHFWFPRLARLHMHEVKRWNWLKGNMTSSIAQAPAHGPEIMHTYVHADTHPLQCKAQLWNQLFQCVWIITCQHKFSLPLNGLEFKFSYLP